MPRYCRLRSRLRRPIPRGDEGYWLGVGGQGVLIQPVQNRLERATLILIGALGEIRTPDLGNSKSLVPPQQEPTPPNNSLGPSLGSGCAAGISHLLWLCVYFMG